MPRIALFLALTIPLTAAEAVNSIGMRLVKIEPGAFRMGEVNAVPDELLVPLTYPRRDELAQRFPLADPRRFVIPFEASRRGDYDEKPVHGVTISRPFFMGATEVTNRQYEQFDSAHRALRGRNGFSKDDDEAVVFVSWHDARAFCEWLSKKEGRPYRLPTEAEWEYAARAGTSTLFSTGHTLPPAFLKNARSTDFRAPEDVVSLAAGQTPPNPWGLFDMHGNVEEWTGDWYGPYPAAAQRDPVGRAEGDFKVTRGGSHGTDPYYLRSANRMGSLPETRNWLIGFRVVQGQAPASKPLPVRPPPPATPPARAGAVHDPDIPYFAGPRQFVKIPPGSHGPLYSHHNHDTAIAECPNGDLLAIWYTCQQERGRELAVASSRLRRGAAEWEPAEAFWDAPDRNDHCPALWFDGKETLYHINGLGAAGRWEPLAVVLRTSKDSGRTWSRARLIVPEFGFRNMVGQPVFRARDGSIVFGADAAGGSTIWVSRDEGQTWSDPGGHIRGIHAGIVELLDGRLMALGRGENIDGRMPLSLSSDMGRSWQARSSEFPPLGGGQRLVLMRLEEGALFLASFTVGRRQVSSIFGALSFDEGKTWPVQRVISGETASRGSTTIDGGRIRLSAGTSEPQGYLAACQARNGLIHLISSYNHYAFNTAWLKAEPPPPAPPSPRPLPLRRRLPAMTSANGTAPLEGLDPARGVTVELRTSGPAAWKLFVRTGPLTTNQYSIRVTSSEVEYWYDGQFRKIAGGPASGSYRLAVREDTCVQIYRDGTLLAVEPPDLIIDWRQPARGSYVEWSVDGKSQVRLGSDLGGAFGP